MADKLIERISKISAVILLLVVAALSVYSVIHLEINDANKRITYLNSGWVDENEKAATLDSFSDTENAEVRRVSVNISGENDILAFSARNMYVDVYLDNQLVSMDDKEQFFLFGKSPGTRWHLISLPTAHKVVTIELRGISCFENAHGYIDDICVGDADIIYHKTILSKILIFIFNTIWQLFALVLIIMYLVMQKKQKMDKDFLYLAVGTYFCAQWCNAETNIIQFLIGYSESIHLIEYLSLFAIPIPFGLLAGEQLKRKWIAHTYTFVAELNLLIAVALHASGIKEFHYTIWTVYVLLLFLIPLGVITMRHYASNQNVKYASKYFLGVFAGAILFVVIGIIRYLTGHYEDYAAFIRWALFLFLLVLILYQIVRLNTVVKKGLESELLHELALTDHLTKFYNRSGFAEHQAEYEAAIAAKDYFGIIQFDVNNLKTVNDNQGHEKGDELICLASSGIYQSFGTTEKCYRMGGDEFLVIIRGENPQAIYEEGKNNLEVYCSYANSVPDRTFDLNIAHGFTMVKDGDTLKSAMDRADELMYENKRKMKGL